MELIQDLIAHGAEATDTDYRGFNMLHYTSDAEIIKLFPSLVNKGDCNGKNTLLLKEETSEHEK